MTKLPYISHAACPKHRDLVAQALVPDAPIELMGRFVEESLDCPDCQRALDEEALALGYEPVTPRPIETAQITSTDGES